MLCNMRVLQSIPFLVCCNVKAPAYLGCMIFNSFENVPLALGLCQAYTKCRFYGLCKVYVILVSPTVNF